MYDSEPTYATVKIVNEHSIMIETSQQISGSVRGCSWLTIDEIPDGYRYVGSVLKMHTIRDPDGYFATWVFRPCSPRRTFPISEERRENLWRMTQYVMSGQLLIELFLMQHDISRNLWLAGSWLLTISCVYLWRNGRSEAQDAESKSLSEAPSRFPGYGQDTTSNLTAKESINEGVTFFHNIY